MSRQGLTSRSEFQSIAEAIYAHVSADHARINFADTLDMTTRFANNQVIQNVAVHEPTLTLEVAFGRKVGRCRTDKFDAASLQALVAKAEQIARLSPEDPEYLEPLGAQKYLDVPTHSSSTARREPADLAVEVAGVVKNCESAGCVGAGIVTANRGSAGVSSNKGLLAFEERTSSTFSLTATLPDSTGWAMNSHRDFSKLGIAGRARRAIDKARTSAAPTEIPAGHYEVIFEPAAVAGLVGPLIWNLDAKDYFKGNSPYANKLGQRLFDERLWIRSAPRNDALLGSGFDGQGLPYGEEAFVEDGVLKQLTWDRFTAQEHNERPIPSPGAVSMGLRTPTHLSLEAMIRDTRRAILVTNFWYIRGVNETDLTLTGMTRDGTFLVENGAIVGGIKSFRWHDSPLRVFKTIAAATAPQEAISNERGKMLLPCLKLPDFNFSSVTRF